ncbi:hypothetical protein [Paraburkholderia fungorum]|uniref:MotA/TolQ/ExbB proton channel domain-containing protein n=1 Tax=Paraburkholderia fungorum TaxID=134537 RepID=A0AAW3US33_9BURK|nr:hypothetical protein [Paraburkholderia fungorum]MBB4513890.1 hypothetical protein [Paraburkholderia fungorum]MBB6201131.1 hypothetical protein [Paraburkholderia fungorum]
MIDKNNSVDSNTSEMNEGESSPADKSSTSKAPSFEYLARVEMSRRTHLRERGKRMFILSIATPIVLAIILLLKPDVLRIFFPYSDYAFLERIGTTAGSVFLLIGLMAISILYLQTGFKSPSKSTGAVEKIFEEAKVRDLANEIKVASTGGSAQPPSVDSKASTLGVADYESLVNAFRQQARLDSKEVIYADLLALARRASNSITTDEIASSEFNKIRSRLAKEIEDLGWRSTFNLTLGMAVSVVGLGLLAWSFFTDSASSSHVATLVANAATSETPNKEMNEAISFAVAFLPRLSFAILIEVLAYFFLRMYKSTLSEIKYFQNEITNIESKVLALRVAMSSDLTAGQAKAIGALVDTERNHILEKGQSTVEIERAKVERMGLTEVTKGFASVVEKLKSSK